MNKIAPYTAVLMAIIVIIMLIFKQGYATGIPVITFFISLAISLRTSPMFKGLSFTVLIFAAVAAALYYPSFFTLVGGFDLKGLIVPLLIIIMFGMGCSMHFNDFIGVIKMPKGVMIGIICQFTIMPIVGYTLASFTNLSPEIQAGIILVGCSPSGLASNVMSFISKSNLALSLTLTAIATLLAPLLTPLLMKTLANQLVPLDFLGMFMSILKIVIFPIVLGLLFNHFFSGRFKWLDKAMPIVSMAGIAIIITIITAAGRDALLTIGLTLIVVVIIHNVLGYIFGYNLSRLLGLDQKSARTIAFEVGMQNGGLASGIALEMGRVATMGLAPAVFGPMMNITGSSLATWWQGKPVKEGQ
jgi:BASS family bile acid:Na+ symporter